MNRTAITIATIAASLLLWATPAVAHTPSVTPSCTGLAVALTQYEGGFNNNTVTTTIDGTATTTGFGGSYSHTFAWSQTVNHSWSVVINANLLTGNPTQYDVTFNGVWKACQAPPTTITTTTTGPTTTTATTVPVATVPATTVPATTTPETSVPEGGPTNTTGPTTTTVPATTVTTPEPPTTIVAVGPLPAPTTTIANPALPNTGNNRIPLAVGVVLVGIGTLATVLARRTSKS